MQFKAFPEDILPFFNGIIAVLTWIAGKLSFSELQALISTNISQVISIHYCFQDYS
jgi:hypothetical protein